MAVRLVDGTSLGFLRTMPMKPQEKFGRQRSPRTTPELGVAVCHKGTQTLPATESPRSPGAWKWKHDRQAFSCPCPAIIPVEFTQHLEVGGPPLPEQLFAMTAPKAPKVARPEKPHVNSKVGEVMTWTPRASQPRVMASLLADNDFQVRKEALEQLGKLRLAEIEAYVEWIVGRLVDEEPQVRVAALHILQKLDSLKLARLSKAIARRLEDSSWAVREAALHVLMRLKAPQLAAHAEQVLELIQDTSPQVRRAAQETLYRLDPHVLADLAHVATLEHAGAHAALQRWRALM